MLDKCTSGAEKPRARSGSCLAKEAAGLRLGLGRWLLTEQTRSLRVAKTPERRLRLAER